MRPPFGNIASRQRSADSRQRSLPAYESTKKSTLWQGAFFIPVSHPQFHPAVDDGSGDEEDEDHEDVVFSLGRHAFHEGSPGSAEAAEFQREGHGFASSQGAEHQRTNDGHVALDLFEEVAFDSQAAAGLGFGDGSVFFNEIRDEAKSCGEHEGVFIGYLQLAHHGGGEVLQFHGAQEIDEDDGHAQHAKGRHHRFFCGATAHFFNDSQKGSKDDEHNEGFDIFEKFTGYEKDEKFQNTEVKEAFRPVKHNGPYGSAQG